MAKGKRRKPAIMVSRAERVQATPQTLAKARGCIIRRLYEAQLIDGQEQDAALEIVAAFNIITSRLGIRPLLLDSLDRGCGEISARGNRLWAQYLRWGRRVIERRHVRPHVIVEWLLMERGIDDGAVREDRKGVLQIALRDWAEVRA